MSPKVRGFNKAFLNKGKKTSSLIKRLKREVKADDAWQKCRKREKEKVSAPV